MQATRLCSTATFGVASIGPRKRSFEHCARAAPTHQTLGFSGGSVSDESFRDIEHGLTQISNTSNPSELRAWGQRREPFRVIERRVAPNWQHIKPSILRVAGFISQEARVPEPKLKFSLNSKPRRDRPQTRRTEPRTTT